MLVKGRLTKDIFPTNYSIYIETEFTTFTYIGKVEIDITFKYDVDKFAIHSSNLQINHVELDKNEINNISFDRRNDLLILTQFVKKGNHKLIITYSGTILNELKGFYKSEYIHNGQKHYIATTQFEPADARKAFPCFDEPYFKATFDITIKTLKELTVLSNCPIKNQINDDRMKIVVFERTPKMSTYIVAFIIGEFDYVENIVTRQNNEQIIIRVYGTKPYADQMNFGLDVTIKGLAWFEEWFDYKYPLTKLDLIGIPDFNSSAMENWGLITFRPESLFCNNDTELSYKEQIVITICHELAHQWFGNLVTMDWWTYLWLNESMATYFGWRVCDELFPHWNVWKKFVLDDHVGAMHLDSLKSSHPIEVPIEDVRDLNQIFDAISYSKGSCLIRFLVNYLGYKFQDGMRKYIHENAYKNTTSQDLWNNLGTSDIMKGWVSQTGYPIVTMSINKNEIHFEQEKFLKVGKSSDKTEWIIPLKIITTELAEDKNDFEIEMDILMNKRKLIIVVDDHIDTKNIIVNPDRIGFYKVAYKNFTPNISLLSEDIVCQLVDEYFSLAYSGYQDINDVFNLINQIDLENIKGYTLWSSIMINFIKIYKLFDDDNIIQTKIVKKILFKIIDCAKKLINKIGYIDKDDDTIDIMNLRPVLINFLNEMNDQDIIIKSNQMFDNGQYQYILNIVGKNADENKYNRIKQLLTNENITAQLRSDIIDAIGTTNNIQLIKNTLQMIDDVFSDKSDKIFKAQDIWALMRSLAINKNSKYLLWDYCVNNWAKILNLFKDGSSGIMHVVKVIGMGFKTQKDLELYQAFFKNRPLGTNMVIEQTIELTRSKILAINRMSTKI